MPLATRLNRGSNILWSLHIKFFNSLTDSHSFHHDILDQWENLDHLLGKMFDKATIEFIKDYFIKFKALKLQY